MRTYTAVSSILWSVLVTNEGCHTCVVDGNCGDINNGACDAACGL
jgi:hypothetical protein